MDTFYKYASCKLKNRRRYIMPKATQQLKDEHEGIKLMFQNFR